jgi:hypothetical protein
VMVAVGAVAMTDVMEVETERQEHAEEMRDAG